MEPLKVYDYLSLARAKVLDRVRPLSAEQYAQEFPIGLGTLARTLTHIMISEWFYILRLQERAVPPYGQWPIRDEKPPPLAVLEGAWAEQAERTRGAIEGVRDWHATIEYRAMSDDGSEDGGGRRGVIVAASACDIFTQLVLHEVHHRAQAMNMLRHLGASVGDIDFNALMYRRREVG